MTKEERQARKHKRCVKRRSQKITFIELYAKYREYNLKISQMRTLHKYGFVWVDNKQKQICDYQEGWCDYPCNGDC